MRVTRLLQTTLLLGVLAGTSCAASIITSIGTLTGTLVVDLNTLAPLAFDVRGTAVLDVSNPGPLGSVLVTDNSAAVPNDVLIAFNSLFTEAGSVTLQGLTGSIVGTDQYLVLSSGVPITSVSDPALSVILQPLVFDFQIVSGTLIDPNTLGFALSLSQIISVPAPVPEPATLALTFFVLLAGSLWRVRRSAE